MSAIGWFDEQIQQRRERDDEVLSDALFQVAGAVTGAKAGDGRRAAQNAVEEILKFYHVPLREVPESLRDLEERLEYLLRPSGVMRRTVKLEKGWRKDASGAMLARRREDGTITALIPGRYTGYTFLDRESGRRLRVTAANEDLFEPEATAFYKPFPPRALGVKDLLRYMTEALTGADLILLCLAALAVTAVGLLTPWMNRLLFSSVLPSGSGRVLLAAGVFLLCARVGALLFGTVRELLLAGINTRLSLSVQAVTMMRILSLPPDFFKTCGSGELSSKAEYVNALCDMLVSTVLSTALTSLFSLLYLPQIAAYAPGLALPALAVIAATTLLSVVSALVQVRVSRERMELGAKETGMSYALISGTQKIKLSGAEKRAFARWAGLYAREAELSYNPPALIRLNGVLSTAIGLAGTIALYYMAVRTGVSVSDYYAFNAAYGMVSGAFLSLTSVALTAAELAGVAEDIRRMPMGMHTLISEGSGGISGGQRQRLIIARAVAPRPRILMFDEATSALDNLTQKQVSEALEGLKCTRIVIAHRLSTIRQCDRIILLEGGKIAEDGTYEELIALGGRFARLVERQRLGDRKEEDTHG